MRWAEHKKSVKARSDPILLAFHSVDREIAQKAGTYKAGTKSQTLELADCIIAATAFCHRAILATGNVRHYPMDDIEKRPMRLG